MEAPDGGPPGDVNGPEGAAAVVFRREAGAVADALVLRLTGSERHGFELNAEDRLRRAPGPACRAFGVNGRPHEPSENTCGGVGAAAEAEAEAGFKEGPRESP